LQAIPVNPIIAKYWKLGGSGGLLGVSTTDILKISKWNRVIPTFCKRFDLLSSFDGSA